MINIISRVVPVSNLSNSKSCPAKQGMTMRTLACDTVQFSGHGKLPLKRVHPNLSKKADDLEILLSQTASHEDAIQLRNTIDKLRSGHFTGVLEGDRNKHTYIDTHFVDGEKVREVTTIPGNCRVEVDYDQEGDVSHIFNRNDKLSAKVITYPNSHAKYTKADFSEDGVLKTDKVFEPDGTERYSAQMFVLSASAFPPELGLKGRVRAYDCMVDGQLKSKLIANDKNQTLATLHFAEDKTLDYAKVFDPNTKKMVKLLEFGEEGMPPIISYPEE